MVYCPSPPWGAKHDVAAARFDRGARTRTARLVQTAGPATERRHCGHTRPSPDGGDGGRRRSGTVVRTRAIGLPDHVGIAHEGHTRGDSDLPVPDRSKTPAATSTCADKFGVCMTAEQNANTRVELTALAARLPAHLSLTAPATWAQWAGATPTYADDIVSCPHIADRLAADLGGSWTYTYGKLPTGPGGCTWTPVPWIPDRPPAERFFVTIGYLSGPADSLLNGPDGCAGNVPGPRIDVAAVRPGAALYGCDDGYQHTFTLAFPDTAGTGVWFLSSWGGVDQPQARPADALVGLIDAATRVYG
jgi:hypothetical protein